MGASSTIYDTLLSGGICHVLVQILRENLDSALLDRTLNTIHHVLRDREKKRPCTLAIMQRVGLINELLKLASVKEDTTGFNLNIVNLSRMYLFCFRICRKIFFVFILKSIFKIKMKIII